MFSKRETKQGMSSSINQEKVLKNKQIKTIKLN